MKFYDENNILIDIEDKEVIEQRYAKQFTEPDDVVLELGARYGSVSCALNAKLNNKLNQVSVEPDSRVWEALESNRALNDCNFHIVKGFISNRKLGLTNLHVCSNGYGATSVEQQDSTILSYTLKEVEEQYNLKFNVLFADCEGFLEVFLDENNYILDQLRMIIYECDYPEKCNYDRIKHMLLEKGYHCLIDEFHSVYIKK